MWYVLLLGLMSTSTYFVDGYHALLQVLYGIEAKAHKK